MKINEKKLQRQLSIIDKWIANGCKGTLEAVTGFGKTYVLILAIERLHKKYPGSPVDIVVPKRSLLNDWINSEYGHIVKHSLKNVYVFVVNTYITFERRFPILLGLDEIHNYASDEFGKVFAVAGVEPVYMSKGKAPFCFGFTATLERNDGKHTYIEEYCPVIDTVDLVEAKREGYISNYKTFNWGLEFNEEDQLEYNRLHDMFNKTFARFEHHFELAMTCGYGRNTVSTLQIPVTRRLPTGTIETTIEHVTKTGEQWRIWFAEKMGWNGDEEHEWSPKAIQNYSQQFSYAMRNRKSLIFKATVKIDAIEKIVNKFPVKTMTFSEDSSFADMVAERLGNKRCRAYHTKIKGTKEIVREEIQLKTKIKYKEKKVIVGADKIRQQTLDDFKVLPEFQVLSCVRSLDEGYDNQKVKIGVQASYNSSKRQDTQRTGRNTRLDEDDIDKIGVVINLYMIGSQEEKWLRLKQTGKHGIKWVTSIDEIEIEDINQSSLNLI